MYPRGGRNIVDPHGAWLPDALAKLRGMARFAEIHSDAFHRIESISRIDGKLRVLDFKLPAVRSAVLDARRRYLPTNISRILIKGVAYGAVR